MIFVSRLVYDVQISNRLVYDVQVFSLTYKFEASMFFLASNQPKNSNTLHPRSDNIRNNSMHSPKPSGKMFDQDGPTTPGGSQARVMPIASLTPYQNR